MIKDKYISPLTDFGFKWLFGNEKHKHLLISFLNDVLELKDKIVDIEYRNLEKLGLNIIDRKAIFDIYCKDSKDEHFIVELQKSKQTYFKDRSIYYTSFPIQEQAKKGDWNYRLSRVYFIGLLEFDMDNDSNYIKKVSLFDEYTKTKFYDKLTYYYIELPKFKKSEKELSSHLEYWLYALKNMENLDEIPSTFKQDENIKEAFDLAEFLKLSKDEQFAYQQELKAKLDYLNVMRYAKSEAKKEGLKEGLKEGKKQGKEEGLKEGLKEGKRQGKLEGLKEGELKAKIEIAKNLLDVLDNETISLKTGLTIDEIENLRG
jgi:predicted transposase/invertase (TIGR01784 family)